MAHAKKYYAVGAEPIRPQLPHSKQQEVQRAIARILATTKAEGGDARAEGQAVSGAGAGACAPASGHLPTAEVPPGTPGADFALDDRYLTNYMHRVQSPDH